MIFKGVSKGVSRGSADRGSVFCRSPKTTDSIERDLSDPLSDRNHNKSRIDKLDLQPRSIDSVNYQKSKAVPCH